MFTNNLVIFLLMEKPINSKKTHMKKINIVFVLIVTVLGINYLTAQDTGISKSLGVYVFPSNDQDAQTQETDENACFKWAKEQTGYDPLNPPEVEAAHVDKSPDGAAIKGAAVGAAGGAAIGAITGDAGEGAAIGAIVGGIRGRRAKKRADNQQEQSNSNAASEYSNSLLNDYKKAFSACMEGKGYTVK